MIISQGPLPNDGEAVDPATFLEAWISGTTVVDLQSPAFSGGALQFVYSQTEPPNLGERFVGMLWFKRGEGRLYMWDQPDLPSGLTFSDKNWIALSDRKEVWCMACAEIELGMPLSFMYTTASGYGGPLLTNDDQTINEDPFARPIWLVTTHSHGSGATNVLGPAVWVAMETASSGTLFRACELGICWGLYDQSAVSGVGVVDERYPGLFYQTDPSCGSQCPIMPVTEILSGESVAAGLGHLERTFLHISPLIATNTTV